MKKLISIVLALTLLAGMWVCIPLQAGAVTSVSNGKVSGNVYQDITFSDYLTEEMTSDEILNVLMSLGITLNNGSVACAFADGVLKIEKASDSATDTPLINLVSNAPSLQNADSVVIDLGISVSQPEGATVWAFNIVNSTGAGGANESNCYKVQFTSVKNDAGERFYKVDPGVKIDGAQLVTTGTTRIIKAQTNTDQTKYPNASVSFAETTALSLNVDRYSGLSASIDGQLATTFYQATAALTKWRENYDAFTNSPNIRMAINGTEAGFATIGLEYVRIYDRTPELTITEVMYSGVDAVEVYNSSVSPVNIYDYCMYISTSGALDSFWQDNTGDDIGSKWGTETETIGYTVAGEYTYQYSIPDGKGGDMAAEGNNTSVSLTNPAYEEGVLQPGECAVLYIPSNAIGTQTLSEPLSLEEFKTEYGVESKVFYCYSVRNLNIPSDSADTDDDGKAWTSAVIGLGKVTFEDGDHSKPTVAGTTFIRNQPQWPCIRSIDYGMLGSWVVVGYTDESVTVIGQIYPGTGSTAGSSVEFTGCGRFSSLLQSYESEDTHTLGSVLPEQEMVFNSEMTDIYGKTETVSLKFNQTYPLPAVEGAVWKDSAGNPVTKMRANTEETYTQTTDLHTVFCGAQSTQKLTEEGTYDVRLIASIDSMDYQGAGFRISASYGDGQSKTWDASCHYVYTSILGDGVEYEAADFNGVYLIVIHIKDIPQDVGEVTYTVVPFVQTEEGTVVDGIGGTVALAAPEN